MAVGMAIAERHLERGLRRRAGRSPHLRDRRRRLPDGRRQSRGRRARRASQARPADRSVGRQQHHHRRLDRAVAQRGCGRAPRRRRSGTRCECDGLDADDVEPGDRGSDRRSAAEPDPLQDDHRLRRAQQAGHRGDPRRGAWARTRSPPRATSWAGTRRRSRFPTMCSRRWRAAGKRGAVEHALWNERLEASGRKDEFLAPHERQGQRCLAQAAISTSCSPI